MIVRFIDGDEYTEDNDCPGLTDWQDLMRNFFVPDLLTLVMNWIMFQDNS